MRKLLFKKTCYMTNLYANSGIIKQEKSVIHSANISWASVMFQHCAKNTDTKINNSASVRKESSFREGGRWVSKEYGVTLLYESLWEVGGCTEGGVGREEPPKAVPAEDINKRGPGDGALQEEGHYGPAVSHCRQGRGRGSGGT